MKEFFNKIVAWIKAHVWQSILIGVSTVAVVATAITLPLVLGKEAPAVEDNYRLVKVVGKFGPTKESALITEHTDYVYTDGVLTEEIIYDYDRQGVAFIEEHTVYTKNSDLEKDYVTSFYDDGSLEDMEHYIYKYNENGDLIYEYYGDKRSGREAYLDRIDIDYTYNFNSQGKLESIIKHDKADLPEWQKETFEYDNLGRKITVTEYAGNGEEPVYEPREKHTYSYVDDTNYIAEEARYDYALNDFNFTGKEKYSYNSSMLVIKLESYDHNSVITNYNEITYEGNKVITSHYNNDSIQQITTLEYASNYVEGMKNAVNQTVIKYNHGELSVKSVTKNSYIANGQPSLIEYESYDYNGNDWTLGFYQSFEYTYEKI